MMQHEVVMNDSEIHDDDHRDNIVVKSNALLDKKTREELLRGCRLAAELEARLRYIGTRQQTMCETNLVEQTKVGDVIRCSLALASTNIASTFNNAVTLLLQPTLSETSINKIPNEILPQTSEPLQKGIEMGQLQGPKMTSNRNNDNKKNHIKGLLMSPPISPTRSRTSESNCLSDGSPSSYEMSAEMSLQLPDSSTNTPRPSASVRATIPRKRKLLPKVTLRMVGGSSDNGNEGLPPEDGHTWRKYGQKLILGAHFPRSYYRCTHKKDMGCVAIRQVQRCDEDPSFFEVTYKGHHTCRSTNVDWPLAFPHSNSSVVVSTSLSSQIFEHIHPSFISYIINSNTNDNNNHEYNGNIYTSGVVSSTSSTNTTQQPMPDFCKSQDLMTIPKLMDGKATHSLDVITQPTPQLSAKRELSPDVVLANVWSKEHPMSSTTIEPTIPYVAMPRKSEVLSLPTCSRVHVINSEFLSTRHSNITEQHNPHRDITPSIFESMELANFLDETIDYVSMT